MFPADSASSTRLMSWSRAKFYFHIRTQQSFDPDYEGFDIRTEDGTAEAVAIAREMVAKLVANKEPIDGLTFEMTDGDGLLVAEIPLRCCAQIQLVAELAFRSCLTLQ